MADDAPPPGALVGVRVLELGGGVPGAFAARLLGDLGADVVKVEPPGGDPARALHPIGEDADSLVFEYLNWGKRGATLDPSRAADRDAVAALAAAADAVLDCRGPGDAVAWGLEPRALHRVTPALVFTSIAPFGADGPYADWAAGDLVLQAMSGVMAISGTAEREPLKHGLRQGLYCAGLNAAWVTAAGLVSARRTGSGPWIDLSMHECLASELVLNHAHYAFLGAVQGRRPERQDPLAGDPLPARDGWVSLQTSGLIGPDRIAELFGDERLAEPRFASGELRVRHAEALHAILAERLAGERAADFFAGASRAGLLAGFVQDARGLLACPQMAARGALHAFDDLAAGGAPVRFPAAPAALSATPMRVRARAPRPGEHTDAVRAGWGERGAAPVAAHAPRPPGAGPLHGVRVLDLSTVFAVPYMGALLADLGAEVVKIEAVRRLDQTRTAYGPFADNAPGERWWDRASTFQVVNRGKRSLTLDLKTEDGRDLLRRLVRESDVLLENFTPRVMLGWGMGFAQLRELNPRLVMLSNTGYGGTGPWSAFRAQGTSLEATMGITHVTGYPGGRPSKAGQSYPDFLACWTGLLALMAALLHRDRTGEGQHIDLGMYQLGAVVMPEALLAVQATGREPARAGNDDPDAVLSGLYAAAGEDRWLAVAVADAAGLEALASLVPGAAQDPHGALAAWSAARDVWAAAAELQAAGIAAGPVLDARDLVCDAHLCHRRFYEDVDHGDGLGVRPLIGRPFRWHDAATAVGVRGPAPRFGEGNGELGRALLGLDDRRIAELHERAVMAAAPLDVRTPRAVDLEAALAAGALRRVDAGYRRVLARRCGGAGRPTTEGRAEMGEYDLVVIGMGAAGLSAAVSHAEAAAAQGRRARVAVLERAPREERGGSTRYTSSWFRVTEDRALDPRFVERMAEVSGGLADLDYCRALERELPASIAFLEEHGVPYVYFKQGLPNRNTGGGLGMPAEKGLGIVDGLAGVLERTDGVELLYETEAVRLCVSAEGRICGVVVRGRDGLLRELHAGAVVIACGGFEGNREMLTQYLGERACDIPVISPGTGNNRGEGIRMAMEVGADTAGQFDMFHAEPVDPRADHPDPVMYGYPYGIVVNRHARRFFDEGKNSFDSTFEELGYEIWRHQDQTAFLICDATSRTVEGFEMINFSEVPPVEADTLQELAQALGLDPEALAATVAEFNAAVGPGEFDPYRFDGRATVGLAPPKSNWAFPLESPPYAAWPLSCAICFTFGGVRTDAVGRVVSPSATPIPGLYAAGEVVGCYYHEYPVGTSVIRGVTFGRLAGAHAAQEAAAAGSGAGPALAGAPG